MLFRSISVTALALFHLPVAVIPMCASILEALYGKASTLVEVSFGPLKAKLERDVSEAEKLVAKLRELAALQAKAAIGAAVRTGRWANNGEGWIYDKVVALETALRDMGVSDETLGDAQADFLAFTISDLGRSEETPY